MYRTYFDETGSTGSNYSDPEQPIQGLWSVSIHENQIGDVEHSYLQVVAKHFPAKQGLFLNIPGFEFHAADIFHRRGIFGSKSLQETQELFQDIINIIADHHLPVTGVSAQKQRALDILKWYEVPADLGDEGPKNLDETLFSLLVRGLATALNDPSALERIVLMGDRGSVRPGRAEQLRQLLSSDEAGKLVQTVSFDESHRSFGIQFADVIAYLLQRKFRRPEEENAAAGCLLDTVDLHLNLGDSRVINVREGILAFRTGWVRT